MPLTPLFAPLSFVILHKPAHTFSTQALRDVGQLITTCIGWVHTQAAVDGNLSSLGYIHAVLLRPLY